MTTRPRTEPVDSGEEQTGATVDAEVPERAREDEAVRDEGDVDQQGDEEDGEPLRCPPCPGAPTAAERSAHEIAHWPYRQWCEWCVRGRAVGPNSKKIPAANRETLIPKAHLDYAFLQDEVIEDNGEFGESASVSTSMTMLVMVETMCDSVWTYATNAKGYASDPWLPKKLQSDLTTVGMGLVRIVVKTDTEPAILDLRREMAKGRGDAPTGFEDSRVGDSNSNAKIERVIRDVKGLVRTLRADLQDKIKKPVNLDSPIVPWMIRHAGYVLTRVRVHPCGRTSLTRMKGQKTHRPMLPFGEAVMFKIPMTKRRIGDFEDRFEKGVWVGMTVQSGENIVATKDGVYRTGGVIRCAPDQRWSADKIMTIVGTPSEPRPGSGSDVIPTYAKHREAVVDDAKYQKAPEMAIPQVRPAYIYKNDVVNHGPSPGCKACNIAVSRGNSTGYTHTPTCRMRFEDIFKNMGSERLKRADARMDEAVYRHSEATEAPAVPEEGEKMDDDMTEAAEDAQAGTSDASAPAAEQPSNPGPTSHTGAVRKRTEVLEKKIKDAETRLEEGRRVRDKKRSARDDTEDAPHGPGQASSSTLALPSSSTAAAPATASSNPLEKKLKPTLKDGTKRRAQGELEGEPASVYRCLDAELGQAASPAVETPIMALARALISRTNIEVIGDSTVGGRETMKHPGPVIRTEEITTKEKQWQDIGSGIFARTFVQAERLLTTTRGGPPIEDVHRRTIWSLSKGRVIDDCIVDDVADATLNKWLGEPDDIRIELTMKDSMAMFQRTGADVSEVYSQPRVTQAAAEYDKDGVNLQPGWSLDLTRADPSTGEAWDLSRQDVQSRVIKLVKTTRPLFLIGSPPCTAFSPLQNLSKAKRDPAIVQAELDAGRVHLEFCMRLYAIQVDAARFFVHEHPQDAASWAEDSVKEVMALAGVNMATVDMCVYGMRVDTGPVQGPARKRTILMSNSNEVLKRIASVCPNAGEDKTLHHTHVPLEQGRARRCQVYPRQFSRRICEGIAAEKKLRQLGLMSMALMDCDSIDVDMAVGRKASGDLHDGNGMQAFDDTSGEALIPGMVKKARLEEMEYFRSMKVYEKVPIAECLSATGHKPIGVRWVDINKGDTANPNYRSRLVAKEFRGNDDRPEWYAATPPSECLKIMLHRMASNRKYKLLYADVSRAYFYAPTSRPVYVQLPEEDREPGDENMCGKLRVSMYGTRDAAMNWATEYGETLKKAGFVQGKTSPCLFFHEAKNVAIMVHGDDFVAVGDPANLASTEAALREKYKIKTETLGSAEKDVKEVRILNKIVRVTDDGVELEADPRHAELVVRELGLEGCKPSKTPGAKAPGDHAEHRVIKPSKKQVGVSAMGEVESEGEMIPQSDEDIWTSSGVQGIWRRQHLTTRKTLFTPSGTAGSPARPSGLSGRRVTEGVFDDTGESFIIVDDWKNKRDAHRRLEGSWTGSTTFESETIPQAPGSVGIRSPGTDEADGPAEENDEHRTSERAEPKPDQETVRVRKSAGKIVEIQRVEDDHISIDEVNYAWEVLAAEEKHDDESDPPLEGKEATAYRSVTARLNYIGPDRVDVQYATKEAARHMAAPRATHLEALRKLGKYIAGRPRLVSHFKWQATMSMVTGFTDSDWAGCMATGRSTSGGIITIGAHVIKTYSRQQKTVALSSAEAELHAMVAASAEVLGIIGLAQDLGMQLKGEILADSSAALGISNRSGSGKVRHLRIQALWVQEVRSTGRLGYKKVLGTLNPSDILTKHVPGILLDAHLRTLGMEVRGGRAESAPTLDSIAVEYVHDWIEVLQENKDERKVSFDRSVSFRAIPTAGRQRPTRQSRKDRITWADETDQERGVDHIQDFGGDEIDEDDYELINDDMNEGDSSPVHFYENGYIEGYEDGPLLKEQRLRVRPATNARHKDRDQCEIIGGTNEHALLVLPATDVAKLEGGMNPQSLPPLRDIPSEGRRREPSQQRQKRYRSHDGRVRRSAVKRFGPSCGGGVRGAANSKASRGMRAGRTLGGLGGTEQPPTEIGCGAQATPWGSTRLAGRHGAASPSVSERTAERRAGRAPARAESTGPRALLRPHRAYPALPKRRARAIISPTW